MSNIISGLGSISGLGNFTTLLVSAFNLLITRIIGYTTSIGGGSSYYTTMVGSTGPGFIMIETGGATAYSSDGINWTEGKDATAYGLVSAAFGNGLFVALTDFGQIATSTDGLNWILGPDFSTDNSWRTIEFEDGLFFALGQYGKTAYSADGTNWTLGADLGGSGNGYKTVFENNLFVRVEAAGQTYYSQDAISWTQGANLAVEGDNYWKNIVFGNNLFVALNGRGETAYSTDGITWTSGGTVPGGQESYFGSLGYGNGVFVAIHTAGQTYYSSDLITWTQGTSLNSDEWLHKIFYNNSLFVTLSSPGQVAYSTNGITWNLGTKLNGFWPNTILENGLFISVSDYQGQIAYSTDGITWNLGTNLPNKYWTKIVPGIISTLVETQVSIGNQGSEGAEILAPVDVYTVPVNKTTSVDEVKIKNTSANTITYDLAILNERATLSDANAWKNDQAILAGQTVTLTGSELNLLEPSQRITVFPSAVDVVEVKVYGTETNTYFTASMQQLSSNSGITFSYSNYSGNNTYIRFTGSQEALQSLFAGIDLSALNSTQTVNKKLKLSGFGPVGGDQSSTVVIESYDLGYGPTGFGGTYTVALAPYWNGANPTPDYFEATGANNFPNGFIASY
jgi:hypothetical protein